MYNIPMNLQNIVIILDHPDEARNIGSACRAMANNDIKELRIVGKREDYDAQKVHTLAIHAAYIFDNAKFFDNIIQASADCTMSAGTTRRRGKNRKGKLLLPEEFCEQADFISGNSDGADLDGNDLARNEATVAGENVMAGGKVAVIFGNERTGLTDEQLDMCTLGVAIPSSEEFGSLNLSHAVQIICYHLFRQNKKSSGKKLAGYTPLPLTRIDETVKSICENLKKIGFFKLAGREDMEHFWRSILARAALSESEAKYIEKTFTKMSGLAGKK